MVEVALNSDLSFQSILEVAIVLLSEKYPPANLTFFSFLSCRSSATVM